MNLEIHFSKTRKAEIVPNNQGKWVTLIWTLTQELPNKVWGLESILHCGNGYDQVTAREHAFTYNKENPE